MKSNIQLYIQVSFQSPLDQPLNREYYSICLDYPWNRNSDDNEEDFVRVKNWEEIYYAIKGKVFEMQGLFK